MAIWKQGLVALVILAAAMAAWVRFAPATAPAPLLALAERVGLAAPAAEETAQGGPGGPRRGGFGPSPVVVGEVRSAREETRLDTIGTAEAARSVTLFAPDDGRIVEILFAPGDAVTAGAPLMRLDDRAERIALERARITAELARDRAARFEQLAQSRSASTVQLEEAQAELAQARTDVEAAELALERRTLEAPFSGRLGLSQVEIGQRVTTQTPVVALDDRGRILVRFPVPERLAARVARGDVVETTTAAYPQETFPATITEIDSRVDPDSRALAVRAEIANDADRLRPGMSFTVTLAFPGAERVAVPAQALQWDREGAYVWRVNEGAASQVRVSVAGRVDGNVLVEGGVAPGESVVVEGVQRLREGAPVEVAGEAAIPADAPVDTPRRS
ncbi:efflux RND transporter periplasmic adaptor subunit [Salinarimonas ramus]|uniref:MexH family multidrug efflux RND transporter periplasmic adaptor subunit n=1 Tax=Salinarimonas ramus TaxID=690164 RepID=A0A917QBT2_9HYPH|nr:efflux RND transporter periplasmic adaptor subunit [Salinarimonas ramus]GGK41989.1 MexH family multidrug efflux RND transporter periplasmic adaptor subunit [Salinarimonas ramus]